jgi:hypothetical protein
MVVLMIAILSSAGSVAGAIPAAIAHATAGKIGRDSIPSTPASSRSGRSRQTRHGQDKARGDNCKNAFHDQFHS